MRATFRERISRWTSDRRGGIGVSAALALPGVLVMLALLSDYAMLTKVKGELQAAADAAATAAAHEIPMAKSNQSQVVNAAKTFAMFQLTGNSASPDQEDQLAAAEADGQFAVNASIADDFSAVTVDVAGAWVPLLAQVFVGDISPVHVSATARYLGGANICVLGLSPSSIPGITLWNSAQLTGKNCGVYSNTASSAGLVVMDSAVLTSKLNCVVGGYKTDSAKAVTPPPVSDCPVIDDPLKSRPPPSFSGCDYNSLRISDKTRQLSPGVYCGGLRIDGASKVTLDKGIYVIKGGALIVADTASLSGDGVGFYLTGANSVVWFTANTTIELGAPVDGALAGLLFFEDRAVIGARLHRIASNNARKLLGTIYLSRSILNVDANAPVADQSAYTAIVTQSLQLQSGPNLILNTDYDLTDVPVPAGIAGSSRVILSD